MPDPREVAAVNGFIERFARALRSELKNGDPLCTEEGCQETDEQAWQRIAMKAVEIVEQHLAATVPDADYVLVQSLVDAWEQVGSAATKPIDEQRERALTATKLETALLARLARRPMIDEEAFIDAYLAATEQNIKREMGRLRRMEIPVFLTNEQQRQRRRDAIRVPFRAALEAFAAGGEG